MNRAHHVNKMCVEPDREQATRDISGCDGGELLARRPRTELAVTGQTKNDPRESWNCGSER